MEDDMRESDKGKLPYDQTGLSDEMIGMRISAAARLREFLPPQGVRKAMLRAKMMDELYAARCEVKRISRDIINFDKEV